MGPNVHIKSRLVMDKHYKAATLIEILVVLSILVILTFVSGYAIFNYYQTAIMDSELKVVSTRIQKVRQKAISNGSHSDYSLKLVPGKYVMFEGSTYSDGDPDNEEFGLNNNVFVSSTFTNDIITFSNFTGRTGVNGTITMTAFELTKIITINELGIVESII